MTALITKKRVGLLLIVGVVIALGFFAKRYIQHYTSSFIDVSIESKVLNENRKLFIRLPHNYEPNKSYPLIIKSDGNFNLKRWDESLKSFTQANNLQDSIVVAIPNLVWKNTRNRDLVPPYARREVNTEPRPENEIEVPPLGQADLFLAFIQTEVLPYIEGKYKINENRSLVGFSAGGSFVLYTLVTKPELFTAYFAFSPAAWYDGSVVVSQTKANIHNTQGPRRFLYLSLGGDENPIMKSAFNGLIDTLKTTAPANLDWHFHFSEGAGHVQNPYLSVPLAIEAYQAFRLGAK